MHDRAQVARRTHDRLMPDEPVRIGDACRSFMEQLGRFNHPTGRHLSLVATEPEHAEADMT